MALDNLPPRRDPLLFMSIPTFCIAPTLWREALAAATKSPPVQ